MAKLTIDIPEDYEPSAGELDNFVYLVCKYTVNFPMRNCDLAVCTTMASTRGPIRGSAGLTRLLEVTCEYVWDHLAGEPDEKSPGDLVEHMVPILEEWYSKSTVEERAITG
ncbi:hypothetical protein LCGC14_1609560 [marine sediment metagenome]|uniref:Uncharacterized protein n=1 Tax=marine sediment metagenome TaxID=412755 RepID=A0A0F9I8P1_9ZZZZ